MSGIAALPHKRHPSSSYAKGGIVALAGGGSTSPVGFAETVMGRKEQESAIREYLHDGGINMDPVKQAWCAEFVNASLAHAGIEGTGSPAARSFLKWGDPVLTPHIGDVVVSARAPGHGNAAEGHAGFFQGLDEEGNYRVLGGNTSDMVATGTVPQERVLGIRRTEGMEPPQAQALSAQVPRLAGALTATDLSGGLPMAQPPDLRMQPAQPAEATGAVMTPYMQGMMDQPYYTDPNGQRGVVSLWQRMMRVE